MRQNPISEQATLPFHSVTRCLKNRLIQGGHHLFDLMIQDSLS